MLTNSWSSNLGINYPWYSNHLSCFNFRKRYVIAFYQVSLRSTLVHLNVKVEKLKDIQVTQGLSNVYTWVNHKKRVPRGQLSKGHILIIWWHVPHEKDKARVYRKKMRIVTISVFACFTKPCYLNIFTIFTLIVTLAWLKHSVWVASIMHYGQKLQLIPTYLRIFTYDFFLQP